MKRLLVAGSIILASCASGPQFPTEQVNTSLQPKQAAQSSETLVGERVIWGGVVLATRNLEKTSELEVLAYPLDEFNQKPETGDSPLGRFLVSLSGYLETADYGKGRLVTVTGRFSEIEQGKVGQAPYTYPVIEAADMYLWPRDSGVRGPNFRFGVGVIFRN